MLLILNKYFTCRSLLFAATWAMNYRTGVRVRAGTLGLVFQKILRLRSLGDKSAGEVSEYTLVHVYANLLGYKHFAT